MPSHAASGQPIKPHTHTTISLFILFHPRGKHHLHFLILTEPYKEQHWPCPHFFQLYHKLISQELLKFFKQSEWTEKEGQCPFFLHHCGGSEVISNISLPSLKKKQGKKPQLESLHCPSATVSGTMKMGRHQLYWRHTHSQRHLRLFLSLNLKIDLLQN